MAFKTCQMRSVRYVWNTLVYLAIYCCVFPTGNVCIAGGCKVLVQKQVAYVAPVVYTPIVVARVGDDLETEAIVEKKLRERGLNADPIQTANTPPRTNGGVGKVNLLSVHCARCHGVTGNPNAIAAWDMKSLSADQGWNVINMVVNKKNIPDEMKLAINKIKDEEKGTLLDELFSIYNQVNPLKAAELVVDDQYGGF